MAVLAPLAGPGVPELFDIEGCKVLLPWPFGGVLGLLLLLAIEVLLVDLVSYFQDHPWQLGPVPLPFAVHDNTGLGSLNEHSLCHLPV